MAEQHPMPKVTQIPQPPARPNRAVHDAYADEAMRAAQRHIDQIQEIDRLGQELESWRRRAMVAESEIVRLDKRERDLMDQIERRTTQLTDERDAYRNRVNALIAGFHTAGGIILRLLETAQGELQPNINLTTLANEIERIEQQKPNPDEPMPEFLKQGPRGGSE